MWERDKVALHRRVDLAHAVHDGARRVHHLAEGRRRLLTPVLVNIAYSRERATPDLTSKQRRNSVLAQILGSRCGALPRRSIARDWLV